MSYRLLAWLVAMSVFIAGCSSTQPASLPSSCTGNPNSEEELTVVLGSKVSISLYSGDTVTGSVLQITNETLLIQKSGNYGYREIEETCADIDTIEIVQYSKTNDVFAVGVTAALLGAVVLLIAVGKGLSSLN